MPNVKSLSSESNNTVAFEMIIFSKYRNLCKDFLLKNIFGLKLLTVGVVWRAEVAYFNNKLLQCFIHLGVLFKDNS